ncbi:MAG: sugar ABC transporter substrate-binding protein [Bacteroidota bacterium]
MVSSKRHVFAISVLVLGIVLAAFQVVQAAAPVYLATSIRSLSNPYHATWAKGAGLFADSLKWGKYNVVLTSEGSSQKQLNDIRALVARTNGNVVFSIDPNESPDAVAIANVLEKAGVYFVTWWNKPEDVKVTDYPHWVGHITFDGVDAGYKTAVELFKSFGGKGKIVAVQGMLANSAAITRFQGLQKALKEYPGVELVDQQAGDWQRARAFEIVSNQLVAHPDIKGVWAANDDMAMGALEALRGKGLVGKVKVTGVDAIPEMIEAIDKGEAVATVASDAAWQGGFGLSLALAAKQGKIKVASLPESKREWVAKSVLLTSANIKSWIATNVKGTPKYNWNDFWGKWVKGVK